MFKVQPQTTQYEDDLLIVGEIKDNKKGARKTMPSTRYCHLENKMLTSKIIDKKELPNDSKKPSMHMLYALNTGLLPTTVSNSSNISVSRETIEISRIKQNATENCRQMNNQVSVRWNDKKPLKGPFISQICIDSSENGKQSYNKIPLDSSDFPNTDSNKTSDKKICESNCITYTESSNKRKNETMHTKCNSSYESIRVAKEKTATEMGPKRKIVVVRAVLTDTGIICLKNIPESKNEKCQNVSDTKKSFQKDQPTSKLSKSVRSADKENIYPKTSAESINVPDSNEADKILCKKNVSHDSAKGDFKKQYASNIPQLGSRDKKEVGYFSVTKPETNIFQHKVPFVPKTVKNMQGIRPVFNVVPSIYNSTFSRGYVPLNYQMLSHQRMIGTATRNYTSSGTANQNVPSVILPEQRINYKINNIGTNYGKFPCFPVGSALLRQNNTYVSDLYNTGVTYKTPESSENLKMQTNVSNIISVSCETKKTGNTDSSQNLTPHVQVTKRKTAVSYKNNREVEKTKNGEHSVTNQGKNKVQDVDQKLMKISEFLQDINKTLSGDFECKGLEKSLPIWKMELEECMKSVEKIRSVLSEYQERHK